MLVVLEYRKLLDIVKSKGEELTKEFPFMQKFYEMAKKADDSGNCGCGAKMSLQNESEAVRMKIAQLSEEGKNKFKSIIGASEVVVAYRDGGRVRMLRF